MPALPPRAGAYIVCGVLAAGLCAAPAAWPGAGTSWATVGLLAGVYAAGSRRPVPAVPAAVTGQFWGPPPADRAAPSAGRSSGSTRPASTAPGAPEWCTAVLLAGALLLPPAAAALVAVPGALLGPVERQFAAVRRVWHAAQLSLAAYASSYVFGLCGGRRASVGSGTVDSGYLDQPAVLAPATASAGIFCLAVVALDRGVRATAERSPGGRRPERLLRALAPYAMHGPAGLTMAMLWGTPYGPPAALLVLLPGYASAGLLAACHRERAAHQATIRALLQAVDIKDRYTRGHSERVGRAAAMIARELGIRGNRLEAVRIAGTLHDVGKLGVPTRLLRKNGPLTAEERRLIERHPVHGQEVVRGIGFLREARAAILHHHERMDGKGYPCGLAGREIPLFARVVAVADAFDAMTSTRSYRRGRPVPAAVEELVRCAGSQFDPRMVRALARALQAHGWHPEAAGAGPDRRGSGRQPGGGCDRAERVGQSCGGGCGNVPPPADPSSCSGRPAAGAAGASCESAVPPAAGAGDGTGPGVPLGPSAGRRPRERPGTWSGGGTA
jgi:putative nucleotidyltransferase with HDIG domain